MSRRAMVAGNWKMNGSHAGNAALLEGLVAAMPGHDRIDVVVCPPACYLESVGALCDGGLLLGAQNLADQGKPGAFTGELFGGMLKDVGCSHVIVGHSERRALYGETDEVVATKFRLAQDNGLIPVLCLGESLDQREAGQTEAVLARQLDAVIDHVGIVAFETAVIAYEPVWAIGTGKTASPEQAQGAHAFLRAQLAGRDARIAALVRILYGGSVKPDNARQLFGLEDVDGGLIGGASLKAADFNAICAAAQSA